MLYREIMAVCSEIQTKHINTLCGWNVVFLKCYISLINPLNAKLNPICHLLALLGAHHILHVSRIRVKLYAMKRNKGANSYSRLWMG